MGIQKQLHHNTNEIQPPVPNYLLTRTATGVDKILQIWAFNLISFIQKRSMTTFYFFCKSLQQYQFPELPSGLLTNIVMKAYGIVQCLL